MGPEDELEAALEGRPAHEALVVENHRLGVELAGTRLALGAALKAVVVSKTESMRLRAELADARAALAEARADHARLWERAKFWLGKSGGK